MRNERKIRMYTTKPFKWGNQSKNRVTSPNLPLMVWSMYYAVTLIPPTIHLRSDSEFRLIIVAINVLHIYIIWIVGCARIGCTAYPLLKWIHSHGSRRRISIEYPQKSQFAIQPINEMLSSMQLKHSERNSKTIRKTVKHTVASQRKTEYPPPRNPDPQQLKNYRK